MQNNSTTDRICSECFDPIPDTRSPKALTCSGNCARERNKNRCRDRLQPPCKFKGCDGRAATQSGKTAGLCPAHAWYKNQGRPLVAVTRKVSTKGVCEFSGCNRKRRARGLCYSHYEPKRKGKILEPIIYPPSGPRAVQPIGSEFQKSDGYIRVKTEKGWTTKHRAVMEIFLGRVLKGHEQIHHKNGIRNDNRFENLELWSTSQPSGQRVADKIKWAQEFLVEYGYSIKPESV